MRRLLSVLLALACAGAWARLAAAETALSALKVLPQEAALNVVTIHGFEGKPLPPRWHIMTFDPEADNGVREYVVADGEIIATRSLSQFAAELKESDVVGADLLKVDADKVVKLAEKYALANKAKVAFYNFDLKRDGPRAAPLWHVACFDVEGESLGKVVVTASKGNVVAHDGFPIAPGAEKSERSERDTRLTSREERRQQESRRAEAMRRQLPPPAPPPQPPPDNRGGRFLDRIFGGGR